MFCCPFPHFKFPSVLWFGPVRSLQHFSSQYQLVLFPIFIASFQLLQIILWEIRSFADYHVSLLHHLHTSFRLPSGDLQLLQATEILIFNRKRSQVYLRDFQQLMSHHSSVPGSISHCEYHDQLAYPCPTHQSHIVIPGRA